MTFVIWLLVSAIGATTRFWLERRSVRHFGETWPFGTLAANLLGSLLASWAYFSSFSADSHYVLAGFCAAFTTFGGFMDQSFHRLRHRQIRWHGIAYYIGTIAGSLLFAWLGMQFAIS